MEKFIKTDLALDPCPFCGEIPRVVYTKYFLFPFPDQYQVACKNSNCPVMPDTFPHDELPYAVKAWNTRYDTR